MAAASDKARFYLEQYVPELREYEAKEIFSRDEIASITSKRSDFEHTLNARGSTPADYARYATYEMNLSALLKKRCRRLGIKNTSFSHSGQRTVFFILDRATKKFPGDLGLWMQHINFCKKERANKKLSKVFTRVLRLHPKEHGIWVLAAKHYAETQGDMGTARDYMQRGLRFCKEEKKMWAEYVKLEMVYLAKIAARRKILGLDENKQQKDLEEQVEDENMITLPSVTAEDFEAAASDDEKGLKEVNEDLLKRLQNAPAFTGGIPIAVFDAAMKQFGGKSPEVAEDLFGLIFTFDQVPATPKILDHIVSWLRENAPNSVETIICEAKREFLNTEPIFADFPPALSKSLARVKSGSSKLSERSKAALSEKAVLLLLPFLRSQEELDSDIRKVLEASIKRHLRMTSMTSRKSGGKETGPAAIASSLQKNGKQIEAETILRLSGANEIALA